MIGLHRSCVVLLVWTLLVVTGISGENALTASEIQQLRDNNFTITIDNTSGTITLEHHGYPDHDFEGGWGNNPNQVQYVNHSYTLPLEATVAETKGCAAGLGPVGFAVSGAAFYNPYTGFGWNAVEGPCSEDLDTCFGHPSPDGMYHYHSIPDCLYTGDVRDKFLGVALDGYPIYGPMDADGNNYTSYDLDICHGHLYNGRYIYRATFDFPYIISCFHGNDVKPSNGGGQGPAGGPPPGGAGPGGPPGGQNAPPGGAQNSQCNSAAVQNWQAQTCHVVCENAGTDLDNCQSRSKYATDSSVVVLPSLTIIFGLCCLFNLMV